MCCTHVSCMERQGEGEREREREREGGVRSRATQASARAPDAVAATRGAGGLVEIQVHE